MGWSEDAARNRDLWTKTNAEYTAGRARQKWEQEEITWGIWETPEAELGVLGDVAGLDVVELGCGTAYFSAWLARRGARPVGVDITPAQLDSARTEMAELGLEFPLVEADGAETGLPDASYDLVLSEYGASIWVDPERCSPKQRDCCAPEGGSCSCADRRSRFSARATVKIRSRSASSARSSASDGSTGPTAVSSFTSRMASASASYDRPGSRSKT
jgi:SAM-dependent methyltransferase